MKKVKSKSTEIVIVSFCPALYIAISRYASIVIRYVCLYCDRAKNKKSKKKIVISKAKAESWQKTCSSLSPKTCPSKVFSLLCSISGSSSSSPSFNFPNCHILIECANQLFAHLQSHSSTQTPDPFAVLKKAK